MGKLPDYRQVLLGFSEKCSTAWLHHHGGVTGGAGVYCQVGKFVRHSEIWETWEIWVIHSPWIQFANFTFVQSILKLTIVLISKKYTILDWSYNLSARLFITTCATSRCFAVCLRQNRGSILIQDHMGTPRAKFSRTYSTLYFFGSLIIYSLVATMLLPNRLLAFEHIFIK